jgi:hypothetical protein
MASTTCNVQASMQNTAARQATGLPKLPARSIASRHSVSLSSAATHQRRTQSSKLRVAETEVEADSQVRTCHSLPGKPLLCEFAIVAAIVASGCQRPGKQQPMFGMSLIHPISAECTVHLRHGGDQAGPLPIPAADGAYTTDAGQHPAAGLLSRRCSTHGSRGLCWQHD